MKKLNNIFRIALAAVLSVGFASCEETAPVYEPGSSDLAGCYGVYFPTQEAAKDHTLDPTAAKEIEITVMRQNPEGDITVPVNVVASSLALKSATRSISPRAVFATIFHLPVNICIFFVPLFHKSIVFCFNKCTLSMLIL